MFIKNELKLFYSPPIINEYKIVLYRPHFNFRKETLDLMLNHIMGSGQLINPAVSEIYMRDENDRVFYDAAKAVNACLITGNIKHYPDEHFIITPDVFLQSLFCR